MPVAAPKIAHHRISNQRNRRLGEWERRHRSMNGAPILTIGRWATPGPMARPYNSSPSRIKKLISKLYSSIALVSYAGHWIRLGLDLCWLRLNNLGPHLFNSFQSSIKHSRKILL